VALAGAEAALLTTTGREATLAYFGQLGQETGGPSRPNSALACRYETARRIQRSTGAAGNGKRLMLATASSSSRRTAGLLMVGTLSRPLRWDEFCLAPPARPGRSSMRRSDDAAREFHGAIRAVPRLGGID